MSSKKKKKLFLYRSILLFLLIIINVIVRKLGARSSLFILIQLYTINISKYNTRIYLVFDILIKDINVQINICSTQTKVDNSYLR